jgi:non-ribosomal peptide synthetase component F
MKKPSYLLVSLPICNIILLMKKMNLLPPNVIGEIAIGGDGVGKGYLGKPT